MWYFHSTSRVHPFYAFCRFQVKRSITFAPSLVLARRGILWTDILRSWMLHTRQPWRRLTSTGLVTVSPSVLSSLPTLHPIGSGATWYAKRDSISAWCSGTWHNRPYFCVECKSSTKRSLTMHIVEVFIWYFVILCTGRIGCNEALVPLCTVVGWK